MEGPERSQEALRGLEEPTVCTKKVLVGGIWEQPPSNDHDGIPNFKHPGACLEGPERSPEALRGLEEPTVCTKKVPEKPTV